MGTTQECYVLFWTIPEGNDPTKQQLYGPLNYNDYNNFTVWKKNDLCWIELLEIERFDHLTVCK